MTPAVGADARPAVEAGRVWSSPAKSARRPSGPVLFARYAFGPNRLGYCGPDAVAELFGEGTVGGDDRALRELARSFDGSGRHTIWTASDGSSRVTWVP